MQRDTIYINEKLTQTLISKIFEMGLCLKGEKIAFWQYPDLKSKYGGEMWEILKPYFEGFGLLENVTLHDGDDQWIKNTGYYGFSQRLIKNFRPKGFINILDSLAIYKHGEKEWFISMIFHEDMCLLRLKDTEIFHLKNMGIPFSFSPPNNW